MAGVQIATAQDLCLSIRQSCASLIGNCVCPDDYPGMSFKYVQRQHLAGDTLQQGL